jgi:hypothetical protein
MLALLMESYMYAASRRRSWIYDDVLMYTAPDQR